MIKELRERVLLYYESSAAILSEYVYSDVGVFKPAINLSAFFL